MDLSDNIRRARRVRREEGVKRMIEKSVEYVVEEAVETLIEAPLVWLYTDVLRPYTPIVGRQTLGIEINHSEIKGYEKRLLDDHVGWLYRNQYRTGGEMGFRIAHMGLTRTGDRVGVVGGGRGIGAITAAYQVGDEGEVVIYDGLAGEEHHAFGLKHIRHHLDVNGVTDICELRHGIIGTSRDYLMYDDASAPLVDPAELPDVDVLEMDCNGFELNILRNMEITPRVLIVELEAPFYKEVFGGEEHPREVLSELSDLGYEIVQTMGHEGKNVSHDQLLELIDESFERREKYELANGARASPVVCAVHPDQM